MNEKPNGPPQPVTFRMPLDVLPAWLAFDIGAYVLNGLASQLQFIGKAELAGVMRGFAVGLEQQRQRIVDAVNRGIIVAGPADIPKGQ